MDNFEAAAERVTAAIAEGPFDPDARPFWSPPVDPLQTRNEKFSRGIESPARTRLATALPPSAPSVQAASSSSTGTGRATQS
ncbi:hypothetical protein JIG36_15105 [Actinoplanes sp. LDG1-06]|uniref:Uncharacterized protein n=1 Tax=Paractinoplanes ovalisporus TaxID=2810368 RepID=A0ABS2AAQ0_9ACTN|nr:hypothetical protein [Actinoplanes ovalisporus]MBM2616886.1 hypothetical protein [Actinoplanes ovalisporus]